MFLFQNKCKSHIFGTNCKMNGLNCSYRLIDCFFKRQLLLQFSWSGGSRKEEGKMPFKKYKNIMKLFYGIISKADRQFTETECENFFKGVIKNSKRRFELSENTSEKRRASSGRRRPHDLVYKKPKDDTINPDIMKIPEGDITEVDIHSGETENEVLLEETDEVAKTK